MTTVQHNKIWDLMFNAFCKAPQQKREFLPLMQDKFPEVDVDDLKSMINEVVDEYSSACSHE